MVCIQCNREFIPSHGNQGLCSEECKKLRRKDRDKTYDSRRPEIRAQIAKNARFAKMGLTESGFKQLSLEQDNRCSICHAKVIGPLHMDHNHITGKFRGLLCGSCNRALGLFHDNVESLRNAITYLEQN